MITIDKKHKKEIDAFRKDILAEMAAQDKVFSKLCKKLGIDPDGKDGDALFDHIYNGSIWPVNFK